jgi:GGDEF domain-containing protein
VNDPQQAGDPAGTPQHDLLPVDAAARLFALVTTASEAEAAAIGDRGPGAASTDLARTIDEVHGRADRGPSRLHDLVAAFGRDQAAAGFDPAEVVDAVTAAVGELDEGRRGLFDLTELHRVALTAWARETGRLAQLDQCLDAFTGLHTEAYLRTQIAQLFERCGPLRVHPSSIFGLLRIDLDDGALDPLASLGAVRAVVGHLRRELAAGETVAALGRSTFVALVPVHTIADVSLSSQAAFAVDPALERAGWRVSVAPLGTELVDVLAGLDLPRT